MPPHQRIRVGCTSSNTDHIEWHQKIRDILDIHQPPVNSSVKKKCGRIHRHTICCDRYRDESTASLSNSADSAKPDPISFCDVSPTSPSSRETMDQKESQARSPSPICRENAEPMGIVLAKHRINSPPGSAMLNNNLSPLIKSRSNSPFSKRRCDLPVVPFSPKSDYGSFDENECSNVGSNVPNNCVISVHDDCVSPVTNYEGSEDNTSEASSPEFQWRPNDTHLHTSQDLKPQANAPRRSSYNDRPSFSERYFQNTFTSTNKPLRYTPKRLSLKEPKTNDDVLNIPKGNVSKYSIRVHRGSIGDEPNISVPFNTIPSSMTCRRASEKVEFEFVSTRRNCGNRQRRTTDTDIPREIIMVHCHEEEKQKQGRRASDYMPMTVEKQRQRRRASDYDANERYDKSARNHKEIKNDCKPKSYSMKLGRPVVTALRYC